MGSSLFKYVGSSYVDRVFATQGFVTLKCGTPAEFNDPYELFLTMNFQEQPELIAFYTDVVGQLPNLPKLRTLTGLFKIFWNKRK